MVATWEQGKWPVEVRDEVASELFEDIRRRLWLLQNLGAGSFVTSVWYKGGSVPWTRSNWDGVFVNDGDPPPYQTPTEPGTIIVAFQHPTDGTVRFYSNKDWVYANGIPGTWDPPLNASLFDIYRKVNDQYSNCPLNSDNSLNFHWKPVPNPNKYHTYGYNSGNWKVTWSNGRSWNPPDTYAGYPHCVPIHKYYPRQVDPVRQWPFTWIDEVGGNYNKLGVPAEFVRDYITQVVNTQSIVSSNNYEFGRNWNSSSDYPILSQSKEGLYPDRRNEYHWSTNEPRDARIGIEDQMRYNAMRCEAYQSQVALVLETEGYHPFVREVDEGFIEEWTKVQTLRDWGLGETFNREDMVLHNGVSYVNTVTHVAVANTEPGVGAEWSRVWLTPCYQPNRFGSHPYYASFNSVYWRCNGSSFEKCLKIIGKYDWWWDDKGPTEPHSMHDRRMNFIRGNPEPGYNDIKYYPRPIGCWRRTWRRSMGRVIKSDGVEAKMWPREFGNPYEFFGLDPSKYHVTQEQYDDMFSDERPKYEVVDLDQMWEQYEEKMVANSNQGNDFIVERHDPVQIKHRKISGQWIEYSEYEIHRDIMNDMRSCLLLLYIINGVGIYTITQGAWTWWTKDAPYIENHRWEALARSRTSAEQERAVGTPDPGDPSNPDEMSELSSDVWVQAGYAEGLYHAISTVWWMGTCSGELYANNCWNPAIDNECQFKQKPYVRLEASGIVPLGVKTDSLKVRIEYATDWVPADDPGNNYRKVSGCEIGIGNFRDRPPTDVTRFKLFTHYYIGDVVEDLYEVYTCKKEIDSGWGPGDQRSLPYWTAGIFPTYTAYINLRTPQPGSSFNYLVELYDPWPSLNGEYFSWFDDFYNPGKTRTVHHKTIVRLNKPSYDHPLIVEIDFDKYASSPTSGVFAEDLTIVTHDIHDYDDSMDVREL